MRLAFRGGKTFACLSFDTTKKTYKKWCGTSNRIITLDTQKSLRDLELELIKNGYKEEKL